MSGTGTDARWNTTDPVVLSGLEIHELARANWMTTPGSLAAANWYTTPDGLAADVDGVTFRLNAHTQVYTMAAPPFHPVWLALAEVQYQLSTEVLVHATREDIDEYAVRYTMALCILNDEDAARAQLITYLLMRGVSQHHPGCGNNLIVDVAPKAIERALALAGS